MSNCVLTLGAADAYRRAKSEIGAIVRDIFK
jgi:hypothetical protein